MGFNSGFKGLNISYHKFNYFTSKVEHALLIFHVSLAQHPNLAEYKVSILDLQLNHRANVLSQSPILLFAIPSRLDLEPTHTIKRVPRSTEEPGMTTHDLFSAEDKSCVTLYITSHMHLCCIRWIRNGDGITS